jgi:alcohol dehydrogenase (cytochrome c)
LAAGSELYATHCANCHSLTLRGSAHGTALKGQPFLQRWGERDSTALLRFNRADMPPGNADRLDEEEHLAIVAHILSVNGITLSQPLSAAAPISIAGGEVVAAGEDDTTESWDGAAAVDALARNKSGLVNRPVEDYRPVTEAMLANPPPEDWLSWRRTRDGQAYSPLKQVNRRNVGKLQLAWSLAMHDGSNQATPLVHDGVIYLTHPANIIQALEADTGSLIWEYRYDFPEAARALGGPTRNIAIFDDKLFLTTYDAAIVALDARTGEQLWRTPKADYREAYTHSAGPIVGDGVVLSGINGCELYTADGCFITGHDPDTGKELWRTSTIALPGDPNNASWGDIPPELRGGGDS